MNYCEWAWTWLILATDILVDVVYMLELWIDVWIVDEYLIDVYVPLALHFVKKISYHGEINYD